MFKLIAIGLMASPLALGGATFERLQPLPHRVAYNDVSYSITLTADELNGNSFGNLSTYMAQSMDLADDLVGTSFTYLTNEIALDDVGADYVTYSGFDYFITFNFGSSSQSNFVLNYDSETMDFSADLVWNLNSTLYDSIKDAIQLDIQENSMPSISGIFEQVTTAITAFIGSLGQAFTSVTSLFYASGNWTFLGVLILIGVGVGLVYGAYRIIKGLLHRV